MNTLTDNQELNSLRDSLIAEFEGNTPEPTPQIKPGEPTQGDGSNLKPTETDSPEEPKVVSDQTGKNDSKPAPTKQTEEIKPVEAGKETKETEYSKARRDKERFRVNWNELEKGKTELKAQQAELQARREQLAQAQQQIEQARLAAASATRKETRYSPEQLERYAAEFEQEGRTDLAQAARQKAHEVREALTVEQQQAAKESQQAYAKANEVHWNKAQADFPDVAKEGTPLRQRASQVYDEVAKEMAQHNMRPSPNLQYLAVKHAHALLEAETAKAELENLMKKVAGLESENKRLTKSTALPGATPSQTTSGKKDFGSLSMDQMKADLLKDFTS